MSTPNIITLKLAAAHTALILAFAPPLACANPAVLTEVSMPGESMDAFVVRVSAPALRMTLAQDAEFCGAIARAPDGTYSLNLVTSGNPWTCAIPARSVTPGHTWTGYIFHTHTLRGADSWANADLGHPGYLATVRKVLFQENNKMRKVTTFTEKDSSHR